MNKKKSGALNALWQFIREPLGVLAFMAAATSAVAQPFYVPSGSMEPTLAIGDALIASKFAYGYSRYSLPFGFGPVSDKRLLEKMPVRGDVVIFRLPRDADVTYIKRVIGLPGDRVQMKGGSLFLNGVEVTKRYDGLGAVENRDGSSAPATRFIETLPGGVAHPIYKERWFAALDDTAEFTVPARHLFMMGDNRDNSLDSRVAAADGGVGFVPMENVVGRAEMVIGSYDFLNAKSIAQWPGQIRLARFFQRIR